MFFNDPAMKCGNKVKKGNGKKKEKDVDSLSLDQASLKDVEANLMPVICLEKEW